jgi:hypothetical protein
MGRPTKYSEAVGNAILGWIRLGNTEADAAAAAGIHPATLGRWKVSNAEFRVAVDDAKARAKATAVGEIRAAGLKGDWKASLEYLKRRYPAEWGDRLDIHHVLRVQAERLSAEYNEPVEQVLAELEAHAQKVLG